jgi:hypothetical protein
LILLWAPASGTPVRVRLVLIDEPTVSSVDMTLDEAHLAANSIADALVRARPPEHVPAHEGFTINGRSTT